MQTNHHQDTYKTKSMFTLSIIIPTYNESGNIIKLLDKIKENLYHNIFTEIIVVDDSSPDGTGNIVQNYIDNDDDYKKKKIHLKKILTIQYTFLIEKKRMD